MYDAEHCDGIWGILCLYFVGMLCIIGRSLMYSNDEKDFPANKKYKANVGLMLVQAYACSINVEPGDYFQLLGMRVIFINTIFC